MVSCPPAPWVGGDGEGGFPVSHFQQPSLMLLSETRLCFPAIERCSVHTAFDLGARPSRP